MIRIYFLAVVIVSVSIHTTYSQRGRPPLPPTATRKGSRIGGPSGFNNGDSTVTKSGTRPPYNAWQNKGPPQRIPPPPSSKGNNWGSNNFYQNEYQSGQQSAYKRMGDMYLDPSLHPPVLTRDGDGSSGRSIPHSRKYTARPPTTKPPETPPPTEPPTEPPTQPPTPPPTQPPTPAPTPAPTQPPTPPSRPQTKKPAPSLILSQQPAVPKYTMNQNGQPSNNGEPAGSQNTVAAQPPAASETQGILNEYQNTDTIQAQIFSGPSRGRIPPPPPPPSTAEKQPSTLNDMNNQFKGSLTGHVASKEITYTQTSLSSSSRSAQSWSKPSEVDFAGSSAMTGTETTGKYVLGSNNRKGHMDSYNGGSSNNNGQRISSRNGETAPDVSYLKSSSRSFHSSGNTVGASVLQNHGHLQDGPQQSFDTAKLEQTPNDRVYGAERIHLNKEPPSLSQDNSPSNVASVQESFGTRSDAQIRGRFIQSPMLAQNTRDQYTRNAERSTNNADGLSQREGPTYHADGLPQGVGSTYNVQGSSSGGPTYKAEGSSQRGGSSHNTEGSSGGGSMYNGQGSSTTGGHTYHAEGPYQGVGSVYSGQGSSLSGGPTYHAEGQSGSRGPTQNAEGSYQRGGSTYNSEGISEGVGSIIYSGQSSPPSKGLTSTAEGPSGRIGSMHTREGSYQGGGSTYNPEGALASGGSVYTRKEQSLGSEGSTHNVEGSSARGRSVYNREDLFQSREGHTYNQASTSYPRAGPTNNIGNSSQRGGPVHTTGGKSGREPSSSQSGGGLTYNIQESPQNVGPTGNTYGTSQNAAGSPQVSEESMSNSVGSAQSSYKDGSSHDIAASSVVKFGPPPPRFQQMNQEKNSRGESSSNKSGSKNSDRWTPDMSANQQSSSGSQHTTQPEQGRGQQQTSNNGLRDHTEHMVNFKDPAGVYNANNERKQQYTGTTDPNGESNSARSGTVGKNEGLYDAIQTQREGTNNGSFNVPLSSNTHELPPSSNGGNGGNQNGSHGDRNGGNMGNQSGGTRDRNWGNRDRNGGKGAVRSGENGNGSGREQQSGTGSAQVELSHQGEGSSSSSGSGGPIKKPCSVSPVCGTDGFTYMSDCFIWNGVSKACDGFCPCTKYEPSPPAKPAQQNEAPPIGNDRPDTNKPQYIRPSTDRQPIRTNSVRRGPPPPHRPSSGSRLESVPRPHGRNQPITNQAGVTDAPPTCNCPNVRRPVCGISGTTYENDCFRRCNYDGFKCQGECPCRVNSVSYQSENVYRPSIDSDQSSRNETGSPSSGGNQQSLNQGSENQPGYQGESASYPPKSSNQMSESPIAGPNGVPVRPQPTSVPQYDRTTPYRKPMSELLDASVVPNKVNTVTEQRSNGDTTTIHLLSTTGQSSPEWSPVRPTKASVTVTTSQTYQKPPPRKTNQRPPTRTRVGAKPQTRIVKTVEKERREKENIAGGSGEGVTHYEGVVNGGHSPCGCNDLYAPICGSDGKTYTNPCELSCSSGVETMCNGACPCDPFRFDPIYFCEDFCSRTYQPVCSVWGRQFDNECFRQCSHEAKDCNGECPCQAQYNQPASQPYFDPHPTNPAPIYDPHITEPVQSGSYDPQNFNREPSNQPLSTCECRPGDIDPVCTTTGETLWYGCEAICRGATIACSSECPC